MREDFWVPARAGTGGEGEYAGNTVTMTISAALVESGTAWRSVTLL